MKGGVETRRPSRSPRLGLTDVTPTEAGGVLIEPASPTARWPTIR